MSNILIILDIDETLLHSAEKRLHKEPDFMVRQFYVYTRPYIVEFLNYCMSTFQVAIWTASSEQYAAIVMDELFTDTSSLEFIWTSERCTTKFDPEMMEYYRIKNLKKVFNKGYQKEKILMVDDTPKKLERNYGNHLYVRPFTGADDDQELHLLMKYLDQIKDLPNVRSLEKRGWQRRVP